MAYIREGIHYLAWLSKQVKRRQTRPGKNWTLPAQYGRLKLQKRSWKHLSYLLQTVNLDTRFVAHKGQQRIPGPNFKDSPWPSDFSYAALLSSAFTVWKCTMSTLQRKMNKIHSTGKPAELSGSIQHHGTQTRLSANSAKHATGRRTRYKSLAGKKARKEAGKRKQQGNTPWTTTKNKKHQKKGMREKKETKPAELPDWPAREEKCKQTSEKQEIATTAAITGSCCNNNNDHDAGTAAGVRGIMGKKKKTATKCSNAAAAAARRANEAAATTTIEREHHSLHHLKIITSTTN